MLSSIVAYLLIFLLPVQLGTFFFLESSFVNGIPIDYLAPAFYLTDILALFLAVVHKNVIWETIRSKKTLLILVLMLANIFFALSPTTAFYKSLKLLELFILYIIFKQLSLNPKVILRLLVSMGVLQLFLAVFQVTQGHAFQSIFYFLGERSFTLSTPGIAKVSMQGIEVLRAYGTFSHPNSLAGFYLLLYTFFLYQKSETHNSKLITPFLAISSLLIFLSFSKIAITVFLGVTTWHLLRNKAKCTICTVSKLIIPIVLGALFLSASGDSATVEKRIWLAEKAVIIIQENVFSGVGLGNYLLAQAQFPIPYSYVFLQPVHNIFLLMVAELGIPLFLFFIYLLASFFQKMWKSPTGKAVLCVILVTGFFDHYWLTLQQNMLLVPVIFGLLQSGKRMVQ